jgi:hypothetical protein
LPTAGTACSPGSGARRERRVEDHDVAVETVQVETVHGISFFPACTAAQPSRPSRFWCAWPRGEENSRLSVGCSTATRSKLPSTPRRRREIVGWRVHRRHPQMGRDRLDFRHQPEHSRRRAHDRRCTPVSCSRSSSGRAGAASDPAPAAEPSYARTPRPCASPLRARFPPSAFLQRGSAVNPAGPLCAGVRFQGALRTVVWWGASRVHPSTPRGRGISAVGMAMRGPVWRSDLAPRCDLFVLAQAHCRPV